MAITKQDAKLAAIISFHALAGCAPYMFMVSPNQIEAEIKQFINSSFTNSYGSVLSDGQIYWMWAFMAGGYGFGCALGAPICSYIVGRGGFRNLVMLWKNGLTVFACLLQYLAIVIDRIELLLIGRFISGFGLVATIFIPTFVAECAPTRVRGFYGSMAWFGDPIWAILGTLFPLPMLLGGARWPYSFFIPVPFVLLHMMATPLLPKSPKRLYIIEKDRAAAERAILFYHGADADVDAVIRELDDELASVEEQSMQSMTLWKVFTTAEHRWPLIITTVLYTGLFGVGIDIVFLYSTQSLRMLLGLGTVQATLYTVLFVQMPGILAGVIGILLVERLGRRPLLLAGYMVASVGMLLIMCTGALPQSTFQAVLGICGFALIPIAFNCGPCFISEILPAELAPTQSRHIIAAFSMGFSWIPGTLVMILYSPLEYAIGQFAVAPLLVAQLAVIAFIYFYVPETAGRQVHLIVGGFGNNKEVEQSGDTSTSGAYANPAMDTIAEEGEEIISGGADSAAHGEGKMASESERSSDNRQLIDDANGNGGGTRPILLKQRSQEVRQRKISDKSSQYSNRQKRAASYNAMGNE